MQDHEHTISLDKKGDTNYIDNLNLYALNAKKRMDNNISNLDSAIKTFAAEKLKSQNENVQDPKSLLDKINFKTATFDTLKVEDHHIPDFYSSALQTLAEATDLQVGVEWEIYKENNTIIRDARNAKDLKQDSEYSKLSRLFNAARAADRMIRLGDDSEIRSDDDIDKLGKQQIQLIQSKLKEIVEDFQKNDNILMDDKAFNGFLIEVLKQHGKFNLDNKILLKQLNTTKDLAGLEDKKYNICTIFNQQDQYGKDRIAFISEAIVPPLPDDYNANNQKLRQKDRFNAEMVQAYWSTLSAQETIPTQNLKTLPGLRNAYVQTVGEIHNNSELTIFGKTIHTGTISSAIKGQDGTNYIANMNVAHLNKMNKAVHGPNATLTITSLNSADSFFGNKDDKRAVKQLTKAVKKNIDVKRAVTPMNAFRNIFDSKLKVYNDELTSLGQALKSASKEITNQEQKKAYQKVANYLKGSWRKSDTDAIKAVDQLEDDKVKKILKLAIQTKKSMKKSLAAYLIKALNYILIGYPLAAIFRLPSVLLSSDNQSQERTSNMLLLTNLVNDDKNGIDGLKHRMRNISPHCKSGKDRNGGMLIDWAKKTLEFHFGKHENNVDNLKNQISAGHMQRMAGWLGGGTPGGDGLKTHSGLSGKEYSKHIKNIELKSAKKNKIKSCTKYAGEIVLQKIQSQDNSNSQSIKITSQKQFNDLKDKTVYSQTQKIKIKKDLSENLSKSFP
jgi:hypothetical protein